MRKIEDILQNRIDELHFIQGALNNLELVKKAQESQNEVGWSDFTSNVIRDLKVRMTSLHKGIVKLREEQEKRNKEGALVWTTSIV